MLTLPHFRKAAQQIGFLIFNPRSAVQRLVGWSKIPRRCFAESLQFLVAFFAGVV